MARKNIPCTPICTHAADAGPGALAACPLEIPEADADGCPCRRRIKDTNAPTWSVFECLHPKDHKGRPVMDPVAVRESAHRVAGDRRVHRETVAKTEQMKAAGLIPSRPRPLTPAQTETAHVHVQETQPMSDRSQTTPAATGRFQPATRQKLKLRMAIDGPSGAGKTVTALRCAQSLGQRVAVIDTESGSARKYVGEDFGEGPFVFDVLELTSFSPSEYTSAIDEAGRLGYEVILVDSLSHAWEGRDGALETVDKKGRGSGWKDVTPMHRRMIEAILNSPAHVICTMRSKTEYVYETNDKGKVEPRKVGMAPVQRPGMEYEFDVYGSMDWSHIMTITKSRCRSIDGLIVAKPGGSFMGPVRAWLENGTPAETKVVTPRIGDEQLAEVARLLNELGWSLDKIKQDFPKRYGTTELPQLSRDQGESLVKSLAAQLAAARKRGQATPPAAAASAPSSNGTPATDAQPGSDQPAPPSQPTTVTAEQLQQITEHYRIYIGYRTHWHQADGKNDNESARKFAGLDWQGLLGKYQKTSAKLLTEQQAADFLARLPDKVREAREAAIPF